MRPEATALLGRCTSVIRRVAGMPDYAAFLAHLRAHHPGSPEPTEREYFAQYVAARYGDAPTRCC